LKALDECFEHRGVLDIKDSSKVVIVDITKQSFEGLPNSFPFPRRYYARVLKNLFDAGAKAVGVDIVFDEPSRIPGDDSVFAAALKKYKPVVLAGHSDIDVSGRFKILKSADFYNNIFIKSDSLIGIVFVGNDLDGVYRRYMPFNEFQIGNGQYKLVPSFGFAVLSGYLGAGNSIAADLDSCFRLGNIFIPKFDDTSMLINYPGPTGGFPTYDIYQVIDDSSFKTRDELEFGIETDSYYILKEKGVFKNKIVLIGAEYPESGDLKPIPFSANKDVQSGNSAYGVEIHAAAIETVLDGNFLVRSSQWFDFIEMFLGAFLIALTSFLFKSMRHSRMLLVIFIPFLVTAIVIACSYEAGLIFFEKERLVLNIVYPGIAYGFSYVGTVVYQYVVERKQKAAIKLIFSQYVDPSVVNQLVSNPELVKLGGERKTLSVLFSDIENFTGVSEKMAPEDLITHLNEYLTAMTEIVFKHDGTLDKYIGDAIIAFWGAPIEIKDHAYRVCQSAIEMTKRLEELHAKWTSEEKPILNFRIGINTGEMVVGNVGGSERFDYTVIGDNVNLASRLESANKMYRTRILMSEYTYELVKDRVFARELDLIVVIGKTKPVKIFELLSDEVDNFNEDKKKLVELYCKGISEYRNREWKSASEFFKKGLSIDPSDYPSEMYLERSGIFEIDPPPADWNGVFTMQTK
ncbi:MAG: adenylate/guanylate cyclase domain-containing protein, partial [Candidatus Kryptoniota bacterium]